MGAPSERLCVALYGRSGFGGVIGPFRIFVAVRTRTEASRGMWGCRERLRWEFRAGAQCGMGSRFGV